MRLVSSSSILFILLCLHSSAFAQREKSALLPVTEVKKLANQCSRPSPEKYTDTWIPSKELILKMEKKLPDIKKLTVLDCCIVGDRVEDLERFYMQYIGIVLGGKKLIYISAFADRNPSYPWKEHAVVICDGGTAWGVLYDPATERFFDLAVNGIA